MTYVRKHQPGHRQYTTPIPGTRLHPDVMNAKLEEARKADDAERMQRIITFYED